MCIRDSAYAVAQATAGDTIHLAAGTYTGPGNQHVIISKALTLAGAGADTILTYDPLTEWTLGGRLGILEIRTSDVTVRDLTIRDVPIEGGVPLWGVQIWKSGSTVANATFDTVHFLNKMCIRDSCRPTPKTWTPSPSMKRASCC